MAYSLNGFQSRAENRREPTGKQGTYTPDEKTSMLHSRLLMLAAGAQDQYALVPRHGKAGKICGNN
jgi:hypothetical protein